MVIGIFGESCTGKSTLAGMLSEKLRCEVISGKDYLRLAKNEAVARKLFQEKLDSAMEEGDLIYVISEKEQLGFLPDGSLRVLVTAPLEVIKSRFAQRMKGNLPAPVALMLEKKHGCFDTESWDIKVISGESDPEAVCAEVIGRL